MTSLVILGLLLVATLNTISTVVVLRSPSFNGTQRFLQLLVVWLIPIVGAIVCLTFVASQSRDEAMTGDKTAFVDGPCAVDGRPGDHGIGECGGGDGD